MKVEAKVKSRNPRRSVKQKSPEISSERTPGIVSVVVPFSGKQNIYQRKIYIAGS